MLAAAAARICMQYLPSTYFGYQLTPTCRVHTTNKAREVLRTESRLVTATRA